MRSATVKLALIAAAAALGLFACVAAPSPALAQGIGCNYGAPAIFTCGENLCMSDNAGKGCGDSDCQDPCQNAPAAREADSDRGFRVIGTWEGLLVTSVQTAGMRAGIKAGDVITNVDGMDAQQIVVILTEPPRNSDRLARRAVTVRRR